MSPLQRKGIHLRDNHTIYKHMYLRGFSCGTNKLFILDLSPITRRAQRTSVCYLRFINPAIDRIHDARRSVHHIAGLCSLISRWFNSINANNTTRSSGQKWHEVAARRYSTPTRADNSPARFYRCAQTTRNPHQHVWSQAVLRQQMKRLWLSAASGGVGEQRGTSLWSCGQSATLIPAFALRAILWVGGCPQALQRNNDKVCNPGKLKAQPTIGFRLFRLGGYLNDRIQRTCVVAEAGCTMGESDWVLVVFRRFVCD